MWELIFYVIIRQVSKAIRGFIEQVDIPEEFHDGVFSMMDIENHHCRLKFVCEASSLISSKNRNVGTIVALLNSLIDVEDESFRAVLRGSPSTHLPLCASKISPTPQNDPLGADPFWGRYEPFWETLY